MNNQPNLPLSVFLCLSLPFQLSGCSRISLESDGSKNKQHTLLTDSVPLPTSPASPNNLSEAAVPVNLNGQWRLGFQVENRTLSSTLNFTQHGNSFEGEGKDDQTKRHFLIERGVINGSQISFFKRYDNNDMQPVEHSGQFSILNNDEANVHGPYMTGDYTTIYHDKVLSGPWEAAFAPPEKAIPLNTASTPIEPQPASEPPSAQSGKAPDLSGKWNVGFESNFKTIHSIMYLEQEDGKLTGHGIDLDTKEKFFVTKGWYHFPRMTIIRTYIKGKGTKASRTVTFKAQVSLVNERDYDGPYLNGKTQGGGTWEAEMIK